MVHVIAAQSLPTWWWPVAILSMVIALGLGLLLSTCVIWLISKIVMPGTGTFRNAWRFLGYNFLLGIAMSFVNVAILGSRSVPQTPNGLSILVLIVGFIFSFKIIMHVYEVSLWRALAFKAVYYVLAIGMVVLGIVLSGVFLPPEARDKMKRAFEEARQRAQSTPTPPEAAESPGPSPQPTPSPVPAAPVASVSSLPPDVTLIRPVQIPVMTNGVESGSMTLQGGTRVKLISVVGDQLKIQYMEATTMIPADSTDYKPPEKP